LPLLYQKHSTKLVNTEYSTCDAAGENSYRLSKIHTLRINTRRLEFINSIATPKRASNNLDYLLELPQE